MVSVLLQAGTALRKSTRVVNKPVRVQVSLFSGVKGHCVMPKQKPRAFLVVTHNSVANSRAKITLPEHFTDDMTCLGMFHRLNFAIMFQQCINGVEDTVTALDWHTGASHRHMFSL